MNIISKYQKISTDIVRDISMFTEPTAQKLVVINCRYAPNVEKHVSYFIALFDVGAYL